MSSLMKRSALAATFGVSGLAAASSVAHAQVADVGGVRVTQNATQHLQLGEVQVFQDVSGTNVALGGTATATSVYDVNTGPEKAINNATASNYPNDLYHNLTQNAGEYWQVVFSPSTIDSVTVFGRSDCCTDRDENLTLTLLDSTGAPIAGQSYNFGIGPSLSATIDVVPEPASLGLLGLGAVVLLARRRCR